MTRWGRHKHDDTETALANFALTFAKALLVFCVVLFVMITDDKSKNDDGVRPKAEVLIMVDWPSDVKTDIDTWMRNPADQIIMYQNKEAGKVFLDRDDLGDSCQDTCEETTTLREMVAGEYVLNLNVYFANGVPEGEPLKHPFLVHVKIIRLNPRAVTLWEKDIKVVRSKQEAHVVRFKIEDGLIGDFDESRPTKLMTLFDPPPSPSTPFGGR